MLKVTPVTAMGAVVLWVLSAPAVHAENTEDVQQLKTQLLALKKEYEQRIRLLESRLDELEQRQQTMVTESPDTPVQTSEAANAFNPAIGLIMNGRYQAISNPESPGDPIGFALPAEGGVGDSGLTLDESELSISANIDDRFYGKFTASFVSEDGGDGVEIEEAYIQTLQLPAGLSLKAGRFLPGIGYLNSAHTHTDDFADRPLPYRAMLNTAYKDDGLELRWLAPTDLFMETGVSLLNGGHYPAAGRGHNGLGAWAAFLHLGGDIDDSNSWTAGISYLSAVSRERVAGLSDTAEIFSGDSTLWILDGVWKWAPYGNPYERNFKLQGEYLHRDEQGTVLTSDPSRRDVRQDGWYLQAAYQFMPRWRVGLRVSGLSTDPRPSLPGQEGHPRHYSAMLDWSNSEFSRLRLQFNQDQSQAEDQQQWILQYIVALGAHGAHQF